MIKLNKIEVNSERFLKNEELVTLKGGNQPVNPSCCVCLNGSGNVMGYMAATDQASCQSACSPCGWTGTYGAWSYC
jgi:hypothetical protein